ncbi:MAG: nitroreductase family protein [Candidatus Bathyarchaeia archaeon]
MDQDLLGEVIRSWGHVLDVRTKKQPGEKEPKKYLRTSWKLKRALEVWRARYSLTPDIEWAYDILRRYDSYVVKKLLQITPPVDLGETSNFWEIIKTRRSVRVWDQKRMVSGKQLQRVIDAGRWAPSSCNRQACIFIKIRDPEVKKMVSIVRTGHIEAMIADASVVVLAAVDQRPYSPDEVYAAAMDAAAAIQNVLLAARALGLGGCWIYWHVLDMDMERKLRKKLNIPEHFRIYSIVCLGYPGDDPLTPERKPLELFLR